jgi:hypothetical protein
VDALMSLLIGDSQKIFKVSGKVPEADGCLIDELQGIEGVVWVQIGYGEIWLGVSIEELQPLKASDVITEIRAVLGRRQLSIEPVNPAKR